MSALDEEIVDSATPECRDILNTTTVCVNQLRRTVDDMLDMSKIEEGKLSLAEEPFKVETITKAVISQVKRAAAEKGLETSYSISERCRNVTLLGDSYRMQQILANFAWNSMKARKASHFSQLALAFVATVAASFAFICGDTQS